MKLNSRNRARCSICTKRVKPKEISNGGRGNVCRDCRNRRDRKTYANVRLKKLTRLQRDRAWIDHKNGKDWIDIAHRFDMDEEELIQILLEFLEEDS